ncbi:MAG: phospho-N-acetylmuramoyl-pentapeptide-transferase [Cytophagaceae bacterium]|nr:phospho-N-acetylmuramoyl-pentapeptide-transferase [Cytophagaceae bacterium]MDW8455421.1 phospho-N-acetylmuramoyl-pentapeptide-transferase [Cytophagaceae bacterium]
MFYYVFQYLEQNFDLFGAGLFQYISFRAVAAAMCSLIITMAFGKRLINKLRKLQIGEDIRDLGLDGQMQKKGTPTMGGLIIIAAIVIPTLLFAKPDNVYIILLLITTLWMGIVGFLDDFIKVFKKNKAGLKGKFKIVGQVALGLLVGLTLFYHPDVVIRIYGDVSSCPDGVRDLCYTEAKSLKTTIPFFKNNELDYASIFFFLGENAYVIGYVFVVIFIITAVSNGANITDGIDGLAAGTSAIIAITLAVLAYVSGNKIFADYLNIMYIPYSGEIVIFCAAFSGACIGFLWYNSFPAQVFMGDTGSLCIGGIIAVLALIIRKELLIPILCGIFLVENISVMLQVAYFKYQKKKRGLEYAQKNRLFKMAPLHHHYQKLGYHEAKIVARFWIVGIILAILTISTLKLR